MVSLLNRYPSKLQCLTPLQKLFDLFYCLELFVVHNQSHFPIINESPGVKFNDADLLGMPVRLTVSRRTLKSSSAEVKLRTGKDTELVPLAGVAERLKALLK